MELPSPSPQAHWDTGPTTRPPGPESQGAAAEREAGCTPAPVAPQGCSWTSSGHAPSRPCPVWPPGCPGSDLASLRQPQSQEDFTALWSYRLWLQRKSLTPGRHKLFAFHYRGSVLRFREIRMDCFRAHSHGAHCLDSDRYASLEGYTWPNVRGPCLGRDHAAGMCVPWMIGVTRGHFDYKDAPWGPCLLSLHGSPRGALCPELEGRQGVYRREEAPCANPKRTDPRPRGAFMHVWPLPTPTPPSPHPKTSSGCLFSLHGFHEGTQPYGKLILSQGKPFLGGWSGRDDFCMSGAWG